MMSPTSDLDHLKKATAQTAATLINNGTIVGLGTGSTASFAVSIIAQRVADGLDIIGIPTSEKVEQQAWSMGIPLSTLAEHDHIDVAIDGADEVEIGTRNLIKGRGGALLREKIVAIAAAHLIVVVDDSKLVDRLGTRDPVPLEVVPFANSTMQTSSSGFERRAFRPDGIEQLLPGFYEGFSAFALEVGGQAVMIDAGLRKLGDHLFGISPVMRQELSQHPMVGEGK